MTWLKIYKSLDCCRSRRLLSHQASSLSSDHHDRNPWCICIFNLMKARHGESRTTADENCDDCWTFRISRASKSSIHHLRIAHFHLISSPHRKNTHDLRESNEAHTLLWVLSSNITRLMDLLSIFSREERGGILIPPRRVSNELARQSMLISDLSFRMLFYLKRYS